MTSLDLPAVMLKAATSFVSNQKESACFADYTPPLTDVDIFVCKTCRRADTPDQAVRRLWQVSTPQTCPLGCVSMVLTVYQTAKMGAQLFYSPRPDGPTYAEISIQSRI